MSGSIGGGGTPTQRSTSAPWAPTQPHLNAIMDESARLYGAGVGPRYYPGSTYIGPTSQEMEGMGQVESMARQGNPMFPGLFANAQQQITQGGLSAEQRAGLKPFQEMADMGIGEGNPHLMNVLGQSANKARDTIGGLFSQGGRYGSGVHQGTVAQEVGDLYQRGLSEQMNTDIARKMQAAGALQGVYGQGADRAMQYTQLAPALDELRYADANRLLGVGAAQRGELQAELGENVKRWNANQMRPWDMLNLYGSNIGGMAGYGGTQTATVPQGSALSGILGGASTGAGLAGSMLGAGSPWAWPLMLGGAGLGAFQ